MTIIGGRSAVFCGRTAVPVRCHCSDGGATEVALRWQGASMTSARRLNMGWGFRSCYSPVTPEARFHCGACTA